jgi:hypothetical protein
MYMAEAYRTADGCMQPPGRNIEEKNACWEERVAEKDHTTEEKI